MQGFTYSVIDILGRPGEYRDVRIAAPLPGAATALARVASSPVEAALRAESVVEGILVTGSARADVTLECSRCLTEFQSDITVSVCELFTGPGHEGEEDSYEVTGTEIDLEPMLRDAIVLDLPLNPVCSLDCKGYCAGCGQNLNASGRLGGRAENEGECTCAPDDVDPRWAGLEALRTKLDQ
ncbi:MAG TPA: DUF177 domain-containing protein [Actinomycetota bacterium]|nr:DUF177 domain-containing protein [Actinomycetota bacterium]